MLFPEALLPTWVVCYVPGLMSILNILPAPRSFPFIVPYLLFENTMSVTKFHAMISRLFQLRNSYQWIVTKKLGRSSEADLLALAENESEPLVENNSRHRSSSEPGLTEINKLEMTKKYGKIKRNHLYMKELALAFTLLTTSVRSLLAAQGIHFYFLLFQGITFLVVGLDLIGEQVVEAEDDSNSKRSKTSEGNGSENGGLKTEEEAMGSKNGASEQVKSNQKPPEPPKDYIHVRARRGQATDSHSLAERVRTIKI